MNNQGPLVSIVIPIYNGEEFLQDIYQNFINQSYEQWEVLFVNDLSTDNTLQVITEFSKSDGRFKVLNRKTKGGTAVKGIEYALPYCKGDYFFFMSHDDFMEAAFLQKCVEKALLTGADIIIPNLILYWGENKQTKHGNFPIGNDYSKDLSNREAFMQSLDWNLHGNAFRKMDLVRRVGYKADYYNSCEYYGRIMYLQAQKIVFCDANFYYRQNNPNAITKKFHYFHVDILTTDIMLFEIMKREKFEKNKQKKRLKEITGLYWGWIKTYFGAEMTKEERQYVKQALKDAWKKIIRLWVSIK